MVNYANGKVYKLVNDVDDAVYVGCTCGKLSERLNEHKKASRLKPNIRVYEHVTATGGWKDGGWKIILLAETPCEDREQLHAHERHWVERVGTLNMRVPGRSKTEYVATHREEQAEKARAYRAAHSEKINARRRANYATTAVAAPQPLAARVSVHSDNEPLAATPVPYPKASYTPEMLAYYRHRYAERCKDPAYKEKIRQYSRDARAKKKAHSEAAAVAAEK
jgi:hypothetical protein